jgi:hypothetical protein
MILFTIIIFEKWNIMFTYNIGIIVLQVMDTGYITNSDHDSDFDSISKNIEITSSTSSTNNNEIHINMENSISIENIQEETNLIDYTENQFNKKIQFDLNKIRDMQFTNINPNTILYNTRSNSPVTISNNGSRSNSNNSSNNSSDNENIIDYDTDNHNAIISNYGYKKLSYRDVEKMINKYYDLNNDNKFSSEIDILTTFIKAQKNLFVQSKYSTQRKLNCLMFPSLFLSAFITIIAPFIECNHWSTGFISGLNAIIMLCVSFINYLKLETSMENFLQNAKQYDKLETSLELTSSKLLFIDNNKEKSMIVLNKIREIERKINEIKESSNTLIPEDVKVLFPIICSINIFSFIKKVEIYKKNLIIKFKDVKNEIRYILYKLGHYNTDENKERFKNRLSILYEVKNKLKTEIFDLQCAYSHIDSIFTKEIKNAENKKNTLGCILSSVCFWKKTHDNSHKELNSTIDKYFQFIFVDE